jgi:SAM-dependent methyltransferase
MNRLGFINDMTKIKIITDFPIAFDSQDHIEPCGTKNDNHTNPVYINEVLASFGNRQINYMDLGCSGGQLIADLAKMGHLAVGLEGSDYSIINSRANWPRLYNVNLFTCDISRPFTVTMETGTVNDPIKFDCISAWEVLEHIPGSRIFNLMTNIHKHLKDDGIFIGSVCLTGGAWHPSVYPQKVWEEKIFKPLFKVEPYCFETTMRSTGGSFCVTLRKA